MTTPTLNFFDYTREELGSELMQRFGVPGYRASQLFHWVYRFGVTEFDAMTNVAQKLRTQLAETFTLPQPVIRERQLSNDGSRKYLVEVSNGDLVECVMIKQPKRMTLCVSSQVGCGMGCKFCRTATMGFRRNLSLSEILSQVRAVKEDAKNFGDDFQNIVFMGMGEPLHNFKNVSAAARVLTDQFAYGFSSRRITISTVGLVPAIRKFGEQKVSASLAVSLNGTTDEVRSQIMPVNKNFPLSELLESLRTFPLGPRKKITIEYVMLRGVNDTAEDLARLPKLLRGIAAKVNLIPYNENAGLGFRAPDEKWVLHWMDALQKRGIQATIRWSKGRDIDAACGQLAVSELAKRAAADAASVVPAAISSSSAASLLEARVE